MSIHTLDNPAQPRPSASRVSSKKQSADLNRQVAFMRERYPDAEIIRTSAQDSTSNAKDFLPYWSDYTREISVLWSPTETVPASRRCSNAGGELVVLNPRPQPRRGALTFSTVLRLP